MRKDRPGILDTIIRCARLRCPACGRASVFRAPFSVRHHCPACRALFAREDGFFVGAISVNVVITELVIILLYLVLLATVADRDQLILALLGMVALLFPVAFYHHSWSLWLSFDHVLERLPTYTGRDPPA